jgi:hypothetical protein
MERSTALADTDTEREDSATVDAAQAFGSADADAFDESGNGFAVASSPQEAVASGIGGEVFNGIGSSSRVSVHTSQLLNACDLSGHIFAFLVPV